MRRLPPQLWQKIPGKKAQKLCQLFFFVKYLRYWVTLRLSENKPRPLKAQEAPRGLNHCETKKCTFTATDSQDSLVFVFLWNRPARWRQFYAIWAPWLVCVCSPTERARLLRCQFRTKKNTKNSFEFHPFLIRKKTKQKKINQSMRPKNSHSF